jgi:hypothetical protein
MTSLQKIRRRKKQCHDPKKAEGTFGLEGIVHFAYKLKCKVEPHILLSTQK